MRKTIYFDMDGTLAAYHQHIESLGVDLESITTEEDYEEKIILPHFGSDIFLNLNPLPLLSYLKEWYEETTYSKTNILKKNIAFVSFVGHHKHNLNSIKMKRLWLEKNGLNRMGEFIPLIGQYEDRALLADKNSLLFDDCEYTIELFIKNGG